MVNFVLAVASVVTGMVMLVVTFLTIEIALNAPIMKRRTYAANINRTQGGEVPQVVDCQTLELVKSGGFCLDPDNVFRGGNYLWDEQLCKALEQLFGRGASVGDLGAGLGHYGRCFLREERAIIVLGNTLERNFLDHEYEKKMYSAGLTNAPPVIGSWRGYDGAANIEVVSGGRISHVNLGEQVDLGNRFDWVLSLEVGEHLSPAAEEVFLDNLVRHACVGVVISWAVPMSGVKTNKFHANERPNDYIRGKMEARGLVNDLEQEQHIRAVVTLKWFGHTLMVYRFPIRKC